MSTTPLKKSIKVQLQAFSVGNYIHQSKVAAQFKLHSTDMLAIHYLGQSGEMSAGQLGKTLGLTSGATTAAIDRLTKSGFVLRETQDGDRRQVKVRLNQANSKKLKTTYKTIDTRLAGILDGYSEKDLQIIHGFLNTLIGN